MDGGTGLSGAIVVAVVVVAVAAVVVVSNRMRIR